MIIVWDLYPFWDANRSCAGDAEEIRDSLRREKVGLAKATLVCIDKELETWLLADERALGRMLSTPEHRVRIGRMREPSRYADPKKQISRIFRNHRYRSPRYNPMVHALKIARQVEDCSRVENIPSFARFAGKVKSLAGKCR